MSLGVRKQEQKKKAKHCHTEDKKEIVANGGGAKH